MKFIIHPAFIGESEKIIGCVKNFRSHGQLLGEAVRNSIKVFDLDGRLINIKSFKVPGFINSIVYGYFRKSKARRSYEYANRLLENHIGTPQPIAYFENKGIFGLRDSYYISEQLNADLRYRDLTTNPDYPDREEILRQFVRFTFRLYEKGIEFIDNTSGNTLIIKDGTQSYSFYLVDLNRMNFHNTMPFSKRMSNLAKLTTMDDILRIMSDEYAKLSGRSFEEVYAILYKQAHRFQDQFRRRRRMKDTLRGRRK